MTRPPTIRRSTTTTSDAGTVVSFYNATTNDKAPAEQTSRRGLFYIHRTVMPDRQLFIPAHD